MPPCHCDNLNFQFNIEKMRSNASDTDQTLKTIKTCISKTSSTSFMQKVLLSQQNQNNLFAVSSLSTVNQPINSNYAQTNDIHEFSSLAEKPNSVSNHADAVSKSSNDVTLNKLSTHLSLSKPVTKLTLPSVTIPSTHHIPSHLLIKQLPSQIYSASHTITKPVVDDVKKCIEKKSESGLVEENLKQCSNVEDSKGKAALMTPQTSICLPVINTLPKLYSMIAHNSRKQDRLGCIIDKPGTITKANATEKTNLAEKALVTSQIISSYPHGNISSISPQQTFQEHKQEQSSPLPPQQNDFISPVALVDTNLRCGESILAEPFNDTSKHLSPASNVMSQSSQTLLLALPENFNVSHFSNQTLNLDITSQQILRSLLEPHATMTPLPNQNKNENEDIVEGNGALCGGEIYNESSHTNCDMPASKKNGKDDHQNTQCAKDYFTIIPEPPSTEDDKLSVERTYPFLPNITKLNPIVESEKLQTENNFKDTLTNNLKIQSEVNDIETNASETQEDNANPLPVATINVDMIDGQPMYTIQIMGHYIPLAAITIPTSEGPLYLQSATSNISSQSQVSTPLSTMVSESSCTYTNANDDTITTTTAGANLTVSTTVKPRYTCEICGKSYIRSWSYYGHLRVHAGETKKHACTICEESFAFPTGLKQHMLTHSVEEKGASDEIGKQNQIVDVVGGDPLVPTDEKSSYVCTIPDCDKTLGNASSLKLHQRVHQEAKPYKCSASGCNKAFKTPSELSRHQFRHTGEKPYKCDKCDKAFVRNDDLKRHYFIHTGQKRFRCDQCDFSCIQSFDLVKHKYIHGGEKPYKCNSCSKQFTRPARLREHQRLHTGERPYTCDQCGKSFTQLTSLKSHKLAHGQKAFPCDKCDKMFMNPIELQDHMNTHLGTKPFQCMLCNKTFVSSKTLKRHAIVHTGEKPFECKICKKKFARSSDLKVHMPVHEENKPYKCTECSKMFTRYSSLKEHHRLHTGEYPFRCDICNKIFNHRSHLNVHMRIHTGERPHRCHICLKEFSRKSSLNLHLRVHGASAERNNAVEIEDDEEDDGNVSDTSILDGQDTVHLDTVNVSLLKTIQNVLKRKREESLDSNEEVLSNKRHITEDTIADYTEQVLTNLAREQPHLQVGEVTVVDTSNLSSILQGENQVIVTHLSSDQLAPLADNIINNDYGTVVALGLGDDQTGNDNLVVENLLQLNRFEAVQGLDGHSFVMKEQAEQIQPIDQEQITEWQHDE